MNTLTVSLDCCSFVSYLVRNNTHVLQCLHCTVYSLFNNDMHMDHAHANLKQLRKIVEYTVGHAPFLEQ